MSAELGSIQVRLGTDDAALRSGLASAQGQVKAFGDKVGEIGRTLTTRISAPLLAFGTGAVLAAGQTDRLRLALVAVTGDADEAGRQMERLRDIARAPGLGFAEAIQASVSLQAVGISASEAERTIREFGNALATTGGTKDDFAEVIRQFGQIQSLGKVTAENLNVIRERAPAVAGALQKAFAGVDLTKIPVAEFNKVVLEQLADLGRAAPSLLEPFSNAADDLKSALVPLGQSIAQVLTPVLQGFVGVAESASAAFAALPGPLRNAAVGIGVFAVALGPALLLVAEGAKLLGVLRAGFALLSVATGPVGIALLALGAVAAVVIANYGPISEFFQRTFPGALSVARSAVQTAAATIGSAVEAAKARLQPALDAMSAFWSEHGAEVLAFVQKAFEAVVRVFSSVLKLVAEIVAAGIAFITGDWRAGFEGLERIAQQGLALAARAVGNGLAIISGVFSAWSASFGGSLGTAISGAISEAASAASAAAGRAADALETNLAARTRNSMFDRLRADPSRLFADPAAAGPPRVDVPGATTPLVAGKTEAVVTALTKAQEASKRLRETLAGIVSDTQRTLSAIGQRVRDSFTLPLVGAREKADALRAAYVRAVDAAGGASGVSKELLAQANAAERAASFVENFAAAQIRGVQVQADFADAGRAVASSFGVASAALAAYGDGTERAAAVADALATAQLRGVPAAEAFGAAAAAAAAAFGLAGAGIGVYGDAAARAAALVGGLAAAQVEAVRPSEAVADAARAAGESFGVAAAKLATYNDEAERAASVGAAVARAIRQAQVAALPPAPPKVGLPEAPKGYDYQGAQGTFDDKQKKALAEYTAGFRLLSDAAADFSSRIGDAFGNLVTLQGGFGDFAAAVGQGLVRVLADLAAAVLKAVALQAILSALGIGKVGVGGAATGIGAIIGGAISGLLGVGGASRGVANVAPTVAPAVLAPAAQRTAAPQTAGTGGEMNITFGNARLTGRGTIEIDTSVLLSGTREALSYERASGRGVGTL